MRVVQNPLNPTYSLLVLYLASAATAEILTSINTFGKKLFDALPDTNTNLVCSPFGAHVLLSLLYQGVDESLTATFEKNLGLPDANATAKEYKNILAAFNTPSNVTILVANAVYVSNPTHLKNDFKVKASDYFAASVRNVDFDRRETVDEINNWVKANTDNRIDKLVSPDDLPKQSELMLLNAIYFKGLWKKQFDKASTSAAKFHVSETETVDCQMMRRTGRFSYSDNPEFDAQILKLDYQDERFSMVIVVPNSRIGLDELEKKLESKDVSSLMGDEIELEVTIPRLKIETTLDLRYPLEEIGLGNIFTGKSFPHIIDFAREVGVGKVVQKALLEVNEEGTEAAAGTAAVVVPYSLPFPKREFKADRPFLFYIMGRPRDNTGTRVVLFIGKFISPISTSK